MNSGNDILQFRKHEEVIQYIALDHANEQMNAMFKGDGGAIGLYQDSKVLEWWMVACPELAYFIKEFEDLSCPEA